MNSSYRWWNSFWGPILEANTGNWQSNVELDNNNRILAFPAVYACVTGISTDIAKNRIKVTEEDNDGIWREIFTSPRGRVLVKPNHYQTSIQFFEQWQLSKLLHGNAYILKQRQDARGIVTAMYVLDPMRVVVLVAEDGSVYYELKRDDLSQVTERQQERIIIPASEIIHDMMPALFHPLIGISPLYACALAATLGNKIGDNSALFFANRSMPGGMLTAPGMINQDTADRLKATFEANFSGANFGRLFVGGDGLKFEPIRMTAEASQLAEQAKMSRQDIAMAFRYPEHKLTGGSPPYAGSMQASQMSYFEDCLHDKIEKIEKCLDEGLEFPANQRTEMDVDNLLRMDTGAQIESIAQAVGAGVMAPNEGRFKIELGPKTGGNSPYLQQQNYSLEALAKRDAQADPFASGKQPTPTATLEPAQPNRSAQFTKNQKVRYIKSIVRDALEKTAATA